MKLNERISVIEKAIDRIEILLDAFSNKVISDAGFKTECTGPKCSVCGNWMMSIRQDVRFTCGHE